MLTDKENNFDNNEADDQEIVNDLDMIEEFNENEISEDDYDIEDNNFDGEADEFDNYIDKPPTKEEKFDLLYHFNTNKHRQEGKHRLKRDTIFNFTINHVIITPGLNIQKNYC